MRVVRITKPVDCPVFREWVYHLQADELAEPDRETLLEHVERCGSCERLLEVEDALLRALKRRLPRDEAPAGLEVRIRESLAAEAPATPHGGGSWLRTRGASALAATLLLAALVVPSILDRATPGEWVGSKVRVVRPATIVDHDCDAAGRTLSEQRECRNARHINVLKISDDTYWNVNLDHPSARDIVLEPSQRGRRIVVEADFYPELHAVRLIRVRDPVPRRL